MYELKKLVTDEDWKNYHAIRRVALFEEKGRYGVYQEDHPDEHKPENFPCLLLASKQAVGTVRIDLWDENNAVVRLIAVPKEERNKGHGRNILAMVEKFVKEHGCKRLLLNAAPEAVNFYERAGFKAEIWDEAELKQMIVENCTQMVKEIK
jgi:N-acetylglutamate synthase-like GNAT family acetyltransferase